MYIYPENYEIPIEPEKIILTSGQRTAVKTKMKQYLTNQGKPILLKELVETAHAYIFTTYSVHIHDDELKSIALEIREEWPPIVNEE